MTGSGSTPFSGESNLQFDGSRLSVTGKINVNQQSLSISSGTLAWSLTSGANATVTLNQNVTTFNLSNFTTGDTGILVVKQDSTGGRSMVLPANSQVVGGGTYTPTSASNSIDILGVYYDGTYYYWTIGLASTTGNLLTITNNSDNRILTATGSSTSINGETGLTYDGSTLSVSGAITATSDITAYSSSDRRLKDNINPIPDALNKVMSISGVEFDWNDKADSVNTGHDFGVIAQEILEILPEAVKQRDTGYLAVRYDRIIPLLVEAVKELNKEIKELKSKK
jgi:hypothetical protein